MKYCLSLLLFLFALTGMSQSWQKVNLDRGLFISFPGKPVVRTDDFGGKRWEVQYDSCVFVVSISLFPEKELPETPRQINYALRKMIGSVEARKQKRLLSEKFGKWNGMESIEANMMMPAQSGNRMVLAMGKSYFQSPVMYTLGVVDLHKKPDAGRKVIKTFFESFAKTMTK